MSFLDTVSVGLTCLGLASLSALGCSSKEGDDDAAQAGVGGSSSSGTGGTTSGGSAGSGAASGGAGASSGAGGGMGGSGGQGGSSAGSGGETTGPRGAASLAIETGAGCQLTPHVLDLRVVAGGHPVSASGASEPTPDNTVTPEGVMRVTCELSGGVMTAWITNQLTGEYAEVALLWPMTGSGDVGFNFVAAGGDTNYAGTEAMPCTGTVLMSTDSSVLLKLICPTVTPVRDGVAGVCALGESYLYFDGCKPR